ncbi:Stk1 family PASTA domain-containing Ser/Thr kinase [Catellatospora tritici]|uniref:Stk1 family PASTA domain-containing Ser/Thr kinase n=1 Tax=Catellatospora tritici TaxID=2851566 RepID=UPI001C2CD1EB|nr:Stk1 family PASTA domain-containing Ser/Thr kinase [Catellatospora tritici]MBV1850681.1 PASTA domain-containing protein [Catellatospora tritici]MBV1850934.1 PASTA domain-containing protein [Catellatospora tritici]
MSEKTDKNEKWIITTSTPEVALGQDRAAEVTFTITNQTKRTGRPGIDFHTGTDTDAAWFTVEDYPRPRPGATAPLVVKINVPQTAPAGRYEFQARLTPPPAPGTFGDAEAGDAPEENSVLSRRVAVVVPAPPTPEKKPFPWWIVVAAALAVLVIGVITWLVWPGDDPQAVAPQSSASPSVEPSASPSPVPMTAVPKLVGLNLTDAKAALAKAGFVPGTVQYGWDNSRGPGAVTRQSLPGGASAAKGSTVDLGISAAAAQPVISVPVNNSSVPPGRMPTLNWTQPDSWPVRWLVSVQLERCTRSVVGEVCSLTPAVSSQISRERQFTPALPKPNYDTVNNVRDNGWVTISVQVLDDYGTATTAGTVRVYLEH